MAEESSENSGKDRTKGDDDNDTMVTVSAPGKILIVGGYLVLERPNTGIVIAANRRFYASASSKTTSLAESNSSELDNGASDWERVRIDVVSPQFHTTFHYWLYYRDGTSLNEDNVDVIKILPYDENSSSPQSSNVFIERTLLFGFTYIHASLGHERFHKVFVSSPPSFPILCIDLRADNDFYSSAPHLLRAELSFTPANVSALPNFLPCPTVTDPITQQTKVQVHKTGMGSSAALVTSLVGALLRFFNTISLPSTAPMTTSSPEPLHNDTQQGLAIAHNLAQTCHCLAQGKIGSGFDVSAAVYGSHIYTRFSPDIISDLLVSSQSSLATTSSFSRRLHTLVHNESVWDSNKIPFQLPPHLSILMADLSAGSETPSMARNVLKWKKLHQQNNAGQNPSIWNALTLHNLEIQDMFHQLSSCEEIESAWQSHAPALSKMNATQWEEQLQSSSSTNDDPSYDKLIQLLLSLRSTFQTIRTNLKRMGEEAQVPIEPDTQTELIQNTMNLPGVVMAGVPGAGGDDALFVLYIKGNDTFDGQSDEVRDGIAKFWMECRLDEEGRRRICPLSVRAVGCGHTFGLCQTELNL